MCPTNCCHSYSPVAETSTPERKRAPVFQPRRKLSTPKANTARAAVIRNARRIAAFRSASEKCELEVASLILGLPCPQGLAHDFNQSRRRPKNQTDNVNPVLVQPLVEQDTA